jgi:putrescine carbamoyltransferase
METLFTELMEKAQDGAMLLHCLPANDNEEVTREALEGDYSVAFDEAENRLTAQMAILVYFTHKFSKGATEQTKKNHQDKINKLLSNI